MFCEVYIFLSIHSVIAYSSVLALKVGSLSIERASFCHYCRMIPNAPPLKIIPCLIEPSSVHLSLTARSHIRRPKKSHLQQLFLKLRLKPSPSCFVFAFVFSVQDLAWALRLLLCKKGPDIKLSTPTVMLSFHMNFPSSGYCGQNENAHSYGPGHNIQYKSVISIVPNVL